MLPFVGSGQAKAEGSISSSEGQASQREAIAFNLELPQDISELVRRIGPQKRVILENFHYLDDDKQRQLAFDLRAFQELGLQFVILGVWREKNRLTQFNGDLLDRVLEVPVGPWSTAEFSRVADRGAEALGITFTEGVIDQCARASFSSIGVFQELLKEVCVLSQVGTQAAETNGVGSDSIANAAIESKAEEYASRHQRAMEAIGAGIVSAGAKAGLIPLFLPYYLVRVILESGYDGLATGMRRAVIQEKIQDLHHRPDDVRASDMSNLLYNLAKLQSNKAISPPIIDYDQSSKLLQVVDSTFYFFLKHADLAAIAEELPNPLEE